jgi:ribosome-binding protein aMBF1 (putative translation factor)
MMNIATRNQNIVDCYMAGQTAAELARAFGLSEPRIRQIVAGLKKGKQGREHRPVSDAHKRLGRKVYDYRFDRELSRRFVADKLGWSLSKLANLEEGVVDPTLLDIQDLATFMNINIGELLNNVFSRHQA